MSLKRQAKILTKGQTDAVLAYLTSTRYPERNRAIFLLSVRAGLRAKEIAGLTWAMLTDAEGNIGDAIHLVDQASKGSSGRVIPLNRALGFNGCSSHSGRRGFITNAARKIGTVGGSLRDVQLLAGHASLSTTQRYIEAHADAQRRIVELV